MFATQMNSGDVLVRLKPRGDRARSAERDHRRISGTSSPKAVPDTEIEFVQLLQDMLGDLEGSADADRGQGLRRRPGAAGGDLRSDRDAAREDHRRRGPGRARGGRPRVDLDRRPARRGADWSDRRTRWRRSCRTRGSATWPPTCACTTAPSRCACATRTRSASTPSALADTTVRGKDGQLTPASALVTIEDGPGDPELMRENLRQMALVTARLENRDLGSAVGEIKVDAGVDAAAGRLHLGSRRPVRLAAAIVPRTAAGLGHRHRAGVRHPGRCSSAGSPPALLILAGGAAVARRRVGAAAADRHRPQRVLGDGADPAGRPRGEERHRPARFRRDAATRRACRCTTRSWRPRGSGCARS